MKYCRIEKIDDYASKVVEIFNYNPFEWIPNEEFLKHCIECPDIVSEGFIYDGLNFNELNVSNSKLRQLAYETTLFKQNGTLLILWEGKAITVDQANKVYLEYLAEGSEKALLIQKLIVEAKAYIRELYPDEEATNA